MAKKQEKKVAKEKKAEAPRFFLKSHFFEILLFAFCFLLYCNSIGNNYNMDDELVTRNHRLTSKGIAAIPEIFVSPYYKDEAGYAYEYRPIVLSSFAIEHSIFGENNTISHFINVILYSLCCLLLFIVLKKMLRQYSVLLALTISFLFAAHPAHTEIVCSIKNRDEILGFIFSLFSLWFAIHAVHKNLKWYLLPAGLSFMLALMCKMTFLPFAVLIPFGAIIFTEASFLTVMLLALALALPSFLLIDIGVFYYKLFIEVIIVGSTSLLYAVMHPEKNRIKFSFTLTDVHSSFISDIPFTGFQLNWKETLPRWKDFAVFPAILSTVCFLGFLLGSILTNKSIMLFFLIAMGATEYFTRADKKLFPDFGYMTCLFIGYLQLLTCIRGGFSAKIVNDLLVALLLGELFFGARNLFIPCLILIAGMVASYFVIPIWFDPYDILSVLLLFILLRWKNGKWPIALAVSLTIISFLSSTHKAIVANNWKVIDWANAIQLIIIWALLLKIYTKYIKQILKISLLVCTVMFLPYTFDVQELQVLNHINHFGQNTQTTLYTGKADRPITFIEQPVSYQTPVKLRTGTSFEVLFYYLHKVILPYPMAFYYGYKFVKPESITSALPVVSLLVYLLLFFLALYSLKGNKLISFGLLVYLLSVASVSGYFFPIPGQLGERFLFIPSLGWCIVFVIIISKLFKVKTTAGEISVNNLPRGVKYAFMALLCLYSAITFSRNFDWKDDITLMRHDIGYVQNSAQANNLLALHLMQHSMSLNDRAEQVEYWREAIRHFKKSYQIYPGFYNVPFDLGRVYSLLNEPDSSVFYFQKAIAIDSTNSDAQLNVGNILIGQKKFSEAIPYFECIIRRRPADYVGYQNLSFIYYNLGQYTQSISVNQSAIAVLPPQVAPYVNIAHGYISLNQIDSAKAYLQKALQLNPNDQAIKNVLMETVNHK